MKDALGHGSNAHGGMKASLERKKARYSEAEARISQANALHAEAKAAIKAAKNGAASVYPGWDSGAHDLARQAVGAAGLVKTNLDNGADYQHEAKLHSADSSYQLARQRLDTFKARHGL